jgi:hypothetical protein
MSVGKLSIHPHGSIGLLLLAAGLAASVPAQAADAGLVVARDPVTGQLRAPTAEEARALEQAPKTESLKSSVAPAAAPVARRAANGAVGFHVGEAFMTYSVMRRNADGTMSMQCVTGAQAADKLTKAPQAATGTSHKEHDHAQ